MALAARLTRALGSDHIDFRLRQTDFRDDGALAGIPWLGMPVRDIGTLDRVLVVGSFLRKDHPLLAAKLRQTVRRGAQVSVLNATDDDLLMPLANKLIAAPGDWTSLLGEVAVAIAQSKNIAAPAELASLQPSATAKQIAEATDLLNTEVMTPEHYAAINTAVQIRLTEIDAIIVNATMPTAPAIHDCHRSRGKSMPKESGGYGPSRSSPLSPPRSSGKRFASAGRPTASPSVKPARYGPLRRAEIGRAHV